jgi:hypothetical protein
MVATSDIVSDYASNTMIRTMSPTALFFLGSPTSVVCQKDGRIIAVTSVFFESFVHKFHGGKDCHGMGTPLPSVYWNH